MQSQFYFLSPVEVVKVTQGNLSEVAEWCGGTVEESPNKKKPGTMSPYVEVKCPPNTRLTTAFIGMYVTKRLVVTMNGDLRATFAVFRKEYFNKNYWDTPQKAVSATWDRNAVKKEKPVPTPPKGNSVRLELTGTATNPQTVAEAIGRGMAKSIQQSVQ